MSSSTKHKHTNIPPNTNTPPPPHTIGHTNNRTYLGFGDEELAVVVEEAVQALQHLRRGQVQLVEDEPKSVGVVFV